MKKQMSGFSWKEGHRVQKRRCAHKFVRDMVDSNSHETTRNLASRKKPVDEKRLKLVKEKRSKLVEEKRSPIAYEKAKGPELLHASVIAEKYILKHDETGRNEEDVWGLSGYEILSSEKSC